jgi:hypothetical protein
MFSNQPHTALHRALQSRKHTADQNFFNGTSVALAAARTILFFRIDIDGVLMDNPAPRLPGAACRIVHPP